MKVDPRASMRDAYSLERTQPQRAIMSSGENLYRSARGGSLAAMS
ncbi:MAG: hypothetical protein PVF74_14220 [Anaerolineales bacterium]|jgi:hypothetical protein